MLVGAAVGDAGAVTLAGDSGVVGAGRRWLAQADTTRTANNTILNRENFFMALLVSQRVDGVQAGGPRRRVDAEEQPNRG